MTDNTPFKIALVSNYSQEYTTANYFRDVFKEMGIDFDMFLPRERHKIPYGYNIHFYVDDGTHYTIPRRTEVLTILYLIDTHMGLKSDMIMSRMADVVFCAQNNAVEPLCQVHPNVHWLPLACSPHTHYREAEEKVYDVAFVGAVADNRRAEILDAVQKAFPRSYLGRAERDQIGAIYSSSKIVVNAAINNDINMRYFEGMCSGALLLTDRIIDNGMEQLLEGTEFPVCVFYNDISDLLAKIKYYLQHDEERLQIAEHGRSFAWNHTYRHRWLFVESVATRKRAFKRSISYYLKTLIALKMINASTLMRKYTRYGE